jgi:hypothetical protein
MREQKLVPRQPGRHSITWLINPDTNPESTPVAESSMHGYFVPWIGRRGWGHRARKHLSIALDARTNAGPGTFTNAFKIIPR